jgi:hypothetical protein
VASRICAAFVPFNYPRASTRRRCASIRTVMSLRWPIFMQWPSGCDFFVIIIMLLMRGSLNALLFLRKIQIEILQLDRFNWVPILSARCRKLTLVKKLAWDLNIFGALYQCDQCLFKIWPAIFLSSKRDICAHVYNLMQFIRALKTRSR